MISFLVRLIKTVRFSSSFSDKAGNLNEIMERMAESVEAITDSVKESTQAISLSANNSTEIVGEIQ